MTDGRGLSPDHSAEIAKPALKPFLAVFIDTPDPVRAFTGKRTIEFEGEDWTGIEGIAKIEQVGETTSGSASGVKCTLMRVPSEFREDLADQATRGCAYELWAGVLAPDFKTVIAAKRIWKGTLQGYDIVDAGDTLTVIASGESRMIDQRRPTILRYTDENQQRRHPGDKFFEYVPKLAEVSILWAKAKQDAL